MGINADELITILIINDRYVSGGTEVQTLREKRELEKKGYLVYLITFDPHYPLLIDKDVNDHWMNYPTSFNTFQVLINHTIGSLKYRRILRRKIEEIKPDFIHVNNVFAFPDDVYKSVKKIPAMQTIRDYMIICPKGTCIKTDGTQCKGYRFENCIGCLKLNLRLLMKRILMPRLNRLRSRCFSILVAPSQALVGACQENGLCVRCMNNPFDFSILKKKKVNTSSKVYMYYGKISPIKGIRELIYAFKRFHAFFPDTLLVMYGAVEDSFREEFNVLIRTLEDDCLRYRGSVDNDEIMEIYKQIYCVVVPSLWIENYPNTVLEAIANKTLVIGTNRGGIPELITEADLLFDILNPDDLLNKLKYTYELVPQEYNHIVEAAYNRIRVNNSIEYYMDELEKIVGDRLNR